MPDYLADLLRLNPWLLYLGVFSTCLVLPATVIILAIAAFSGRSVTLGPVSIGPRVDKQAGSSPASANAQSSAVANPSQTVNIVNQVAPPTEEQLTLLADMLVAKIGAREAAEGPAPALPVAVTGSGNWPEWWNGAKYVVEKKLYVSGLGYGILKGSEQDNWRIVATQGLNKLGIIDDRLANDILEFIVFSRGLEEGHVYSEEQLEAMQKLTGYLFSKLVVIPSGPVARY